jgi:hypothetical protein
MPLAMTRPYPHPRTGVYWLRKVVPTNLRAAVGKRELVQSLGTKSPREAREKAPQVLTRFDAIPDTAAPWVAKLASPDLSGPPPVADTSPPLPRHRRVDRQVRRARA